MGRGLRPLSGDALPRDFFDRPVLDVATGLLGAIIEHETAAGLVAVRLTEVEAYAGLDDPGSHAFRGRTPRTAVMFGPPGRVYVYFSYGMHWCMNVVCGPEGEAAAVLLRAGEVVAGHALARSRRPAARGDRELARGPARLTSALGVTGELDGADLLAPDAALRLRAGDAAGGPAARVGSSPRTGVAGPGGIAPWRFFLEGEPSVSPYRPGVSRSPDRPRS